MKSSTTTTMMMTLTTPNDDDDEEEEEYGRHSVSSFVTEESGLEEDEKEEEDDEEDNNEEERKLYTFCKACNNCPYDWTSFFKDKELQLLQKAKEMEEILNHSTKSEVCHKMYKTYIYYKYGSLGKGQRIEISTCVVEKIKEHFPDPSNVYVGFKEANTEEAE